MGKFEEMNLREDACCRAAWQQVNRMKEGIDTIAEVVRRLEEQGIRPEGHSPDTVPLFLWDRLGLACKIQQGLGRYVIVSPQAISVWPIRSGAGYVRPVYMEIWDGDEITLSRIVDELLVLP